jgi:hypothetical protein
MKDLEFSIDEHKSFKKIFISFFLIIVFYFFFEFLRIHDILKLDYIKRFLINRSIDSFVICGWFGYFFKKYKLAFITFLVFLFIHVLDYYEINNRDAIINNFSWFYAIIHSSVYFSVYLIFFLSLIKTSKLNCLLYATPNNLDRYDI